LYTVEINLLFGVSHYIAQLVDIYIWCVCILIERLKKKINVYITQPWRGAWSGGCAVFNRS
jgi:hypothetical protein